MNKKRTVPYHPIGGGQVATTILARMYKDSARDYINNPQYTKTAAIIHYDEANTSA